ncbi:4-(cytidine 5'-diphospho)-2-C-methyl-D-erythritol kinase [candidate division KSB1 bacterium]|nr:4-(cytidine 5'-diphospho)-2-C-methyl-D-erythritol kinase [candidate division KSB1 bacterium]
MESNTKIYSSNAKINIGLRILGKRPDGYHDIETVFQEVDLHDTISMTPAMDGIEITCSHPDLPTDERNLAYKAAALVKKTYSVSSGIQIFIEKRIPFGAGLGGGSSNAAVVLKGLSAIWNLAIPKIELNALALQLGSDVPFFLEGGVALAHGRGEIITKVKSFPNFICLLVYPNIEISTKWSYKNYNLFLTKTKKNVKLGGSFLKSIKLREFRDVFHNDLEGIAFRHYPVLGKIKQQLFHYNAEFALMSGSGSTVYGLFDSETEAQKAKGEFDSLFHTFLTYPV